MTGAAMQDTTHLVALQERLCREKKRLAEATSAAEKAQRQVWVAQAERELDGELKFLGLPAGGIDNLDDDTLLAELLT